MVLAGARGNTLDELLTLFGMEEKRKVAATIKELEGLIKDTADFGSHLAANVGCVSTSKGDNVQPKVTQPISYFWLVQLGNGSYLATL